MKSYKIPIVVLSVFLSILFLYAAAKAQAQTSNAATAMKIINANECLSCHTINGVGGSVGPSLSKEGAKGRSIHWLKVQISDPGAHYPAGIMPRFHLKPAQLEAVAQYLESLK
jgi:mono/diheme cytochrome c family protein